MPLQMRRMASRCAHLLYKGDVCTASALQALLRGCAVTHRLTKKLRLNANAFRSILTTCWWHYLKLNYLDLSNLDLYNSYGLIIFAKIDNDESAESFYYYK